MRIPFHSYYAYFERIRTVPYYPFTLVYAIELLLNVVLPHAGWYCFFSENATVTLKCDYFLHAAGHLYRVSQAFTKNVSPTNLEIVSFQPDSRRIAVWFLSTFKLPCSGRSCWRWIGWSISLLSQIPHGQGYLNKRDAEKSRIHWYYNGEREQAENTE